LLQQVQQQEKQGSMVSTGSWSQQQHQQQQLSEGVDHGQQQQQQVQQQHEQQQQQGQELQGHGRGGLLSPLVASELLDLTETIADIDGLLLSQLYNLKGLTVEEMGQLVGVIQQEVATERSSSGAAAPALQSGGEVVIQGELIASNSTTTTTTTSSSSSRWQLLDQQQHQGATVAAAMQLRGSQASISTTPIFPPALPPPVARSAVLAYIRLGAVAKASAVAHASCRANPKDMQALHAYVMACARREWLMAAVNGIGEMRQWYWQSTSPAAQAETLKAVARSSNPPLGAKLAPHKLLTFFNDWCYPHPKTWSALLEGLWLAGDGGRLLWPTLLQAMQQPYSLMSLQPIPIRQADVGRSKIVGHLFSTMLFAPIGYHAGLNPAAAAAIAYSRRSSSSSSGGGGNGSLRGTGITRDQESLRDLATVLQPLTTNFRSRKSSSRSSAVSSRLPLERQGGGLLALQHIQSAWRQLLEAGVRFSADHALAAALPALMYCKDTNDARQSGEANGC
jgi:hypothetical protein